MYVCKKCLTILRFCIIIMLILTQNIESQWVAIYQQTNKTILIGNLYRPPQGDIKKCIDYLDDVLSDIDLHRVEFILMGDLIIDIMDKNNNYVKDLLNTTKQIGLRQLIKESIRYSQVKDSCLFTNSDDIN